MARANATQGGAHQEQIERVADEPAPLDAPLRLSFDALFQREILIVTTKYSCLFFKLAVNSSCSVVFFIWRIRVNGE